MIPTATNESDSATRSSVNIDHSPLFEGSSPMPEISNNVDSFKRGSNPGHRAARAGEEARSAIQPLMSIAVYLQRMRLPGVISFPARFIPAARYVMCIERGAWLSWRTCGSISKTKRTLREFRCHNTVVFSAFAFTVLRLLKATSLVFRQVQRTLRWLYIEPSALR